MPEEEPVLPVQATAGMPLPWSPPASFVSGAQVVTGPQNTWDSVETSGKPQFPFIPQPSSISI